MASIEDLAPPSVPREAVTHLGEIGGFLEYHFWQGQITYQLTRNGYTSRGIEWTLTDSRDGQKYKLYLLPDNPHVKLSHLLEEG